MEITAGEIEFYLMLMLCDAFAIRVFSDRLIILWHGNISGLVMGTVAINKDIRFSEVELTCFLKKRDQSVFNYLFENYSGVLYATINNIVGDDHTSEDVLQDVFIKIWRKIDQYNPDKSRICTWMLNIARNAAIDTLRSKGEIMKRKIEGDETIFPFSTKSDQTDSIGIRSLVSRLRPEYIVVLDFVYFKGYTVIDTASALCLPVGTVKTRLHLGIKGLRKSFQHVGVKIPI